MNVAVVTVVDWKELGLALGLSPDTLDVIAAQYPRDPRRCLTEVLAEWLQKEGTSWRALVAALREPTVGKEGLANEIAETHGMLTTSLVPRCLGRRKECTCVNSVNQAFLSSQTPVYEASSPLEWQCTLVDVG